MLYICTHVATVGIKRVKQVLSPVCYVPYLTFRAKCYLDHQVGPLCFPDKPEAKEISWKLWQASGVKANVCYLNQYNSYERPRRVNLKVESVLHFRRR